MKYNPRACHSLASLPGFLGRHPLSPPSHSQGLLACLHELAGDLAAVTACTPSPLAPGRRRPGRVRRGGHDPRLPPGPRRPGAPEILVLDAAHGTNPATAAMCGFQVREIPTGPDGDLDLAALSAALGPLTAGIMLTNPSTIGDLDRGIQAVADAVHQVGGVVLL